MSPAETGPALPDRTFAAVVLDWDGTAVPDRRAPAEEVRRRLARLLDQGTHVAVVTGTHVHNVDDQLGLRPAGPGRLLLAVNRGSELFEATADELRLLRRRDETPEVTARLDAAATATLTRLREHGLAAELVSNRLNRRKIDLIPSPEWADPPKAAIARLLDAVGERLSAAGLGTLAQVVSLAESTAAAAGLPDPRVTSDGKHVEIGVTDKADAMADVLAILAAEGVGPELVLVAGDEFGPLGGVAGSDSLMLRAASVPQAGPLTAVSVGREPTGVPEGVLHLPGGPRRFLALLDELGERATRLRAPTAPGDPRWTVRLDGALSPAAAASVGSVGAAGTGVRGLLDEEADEATAMTLVAGAYTGDGPDDGLLGGPPLVAARLRPGEVGTAARLPEGRLLDLRSGVLHRESAAGGVVVRAARFASASHPGVLVARVEVEGVDLRPAPPAEWRRSRGRSGATIEVGSRRRTGSSASRRTAEVIAAVTAAGAGVPDRAAGQARLDAATAEGFELLLCRQRRIWARRWEAVDVRIPGDPEAELGFRFALHQLWSLCGGLPTGEPELAVGARGVSGPGYAGHVFWDADVFVLPALVTIDPAAAAAMVRYRLHRVAAARENARDSGRPGLRFPWESARTGRDVTPRAVTLDGVEIPVLTGDLEEHVTADVAWAIVERARWTDAAVRLSAEEAAVLAGAARYYAARCRVDEAGRAHLDHVIGPDEYHEDVDDNAYTNVMVRWLLREAAARAPADVAATERDGWRRLAAALVDGYDPRRGCHEQFAGYFALEPVVMADLGPVPVAADVRYGRARVAASQVVKQPDVLMLHHLVPQEVPAASLAADVAHYVPRTAHGSSLSPAIVGGVLARAGRPDEGLDLLRLALGFDLHDRNGTTAQGLHLATAAGCWQALLRGVLGAQVRDGALHLDPALPAAWPEVEVRFRCLGADVAVRASPGDLAVATSAPLRAVGPPGWTTRLAGPTLA